MLYNVLKTNGIKIDVKKKLKWGLNHFTVNFN